MKRMMAFLIAVAPTFAIAQSPGANDPAALVSAMQDEGYRAILETDNTGDPRIKSSSGGSNFTINFYGCQNNTNCQDLHFSIAFDKADPMSTSSMNDWNLTSYMGKAHIDDEGDPFFEMFVPGMAQASAASIQRILDRWDTTLGEFKAYIDWNS